MDRLVTFFPRVWSRLRGMTTEEFFRKVEFTFYILYVVLVAICVILSYELGLPQKPFFILAAVSGCYILIFHYLRYKIQLYFNVVFNFGLLLIFISSLLFQTGLIVLPVILICMGVPVVVVFFITCVVYKAWVRNRVELNQPQQEANGQDIELRQENEPQQGNNVQANPLAHGHAHQLVLPDGHVIQLAPHLPNGHVDQIERGQ